ncbi:MAG: hypothetical protein GX785_01865 [Armatimonadetes bacterium]|jgi:2-oxoacid:acceptor oxidoreductase gamma subunit (pyruvate/2-ketoisovalerate family)|nr:hypothetical protein [Armatimonadota bacterium]HOM83274.1 2-oxoacid:acceptor oxidoreductase family protein [Armatimonadota bacterium]HOQ27609.1 2-oxoacid:acceptor oxidoreductase family protein [Armatimonadota bacterium]HPO74873.1 2-oxoacid:acceptor oxidoreductase family protein [Armatimonadota bacterium]
MDSQQSKKHETVEIAIHGRGGQAAKTCGEMLTHALYCKGLHPHGQPRYTADRMGAPVSYAIRFRPDGSRVFDRSWSHRPQFVLLFDLSLVEQLDLASTWEPDATIVLNARQDAPLPSCLASSRVARVDATQIARDMRLMKGSVPILSTAMSGAFARVSGLATLDDVLRTIRDVSHAAVGRVVEANLNAARRGYAEVILP